MDGAQNAGHDENPQRQLPRARRVVVAGIGPSTIVLNVSMAQAAARPGRVIAHLHHLSPERI